METTTTIFDSNRAIHDWRNALAQSPAFRSENLYELETHLRDAIATLERQGLSAEEAFLVGLKRIGKGGALEAEFAKQNSRSVWLDRALWVLIGAQFWMLASSGSFYLGLVLKFCASTFSEWLTTYGLGKLPGASASFVILVCMFPLTLLIGITLLYQIHRWAKRSGWDVPGWFLQRPMWLAGAFALLAWSPLVLSQVMAVLMSKHRMEGLYDPGTSAASTLVAIAINTLLLAVVVHVIARRRLRLRMS